jgi:hypothetical protein
MSFSIICAALASEKAKGRTGRNNSRPAQPFQMFRYCFQAEYTGLASRNAGLAPGLGVNF